MEILNTIISYVILIGASYFFFLKYKKSIIDYQVIDINVSYNQIFQKIKSEYNIDLEFSLSYKISEIAYLSSKRIVLIPHKYFQPSTWSISLIFREIELEMPWIKNKIFYKYRALLHLGLFKFLLIGWIYIFLLFANDVSIPLTIGYMLPLAIIIISNVFIPKKTTEFNRFIQLFQKVKLEEVELKQLMKKSYNQPMTLMAVALSKQFVMIKWLFSNK